MMAATYSIDGSLKLDEAGGSASPSARQKTLAGSVRLSGTGLHSGEQTSVSIHPAPGNSGVVFTDGNHKLPGLAVNVVDTSRGTSLGCNGTRIRTVEHVMSALRGCGVDNAMIEVSGTELPALDGSALPYVEAISDAGLVDLPESRRWITLSEPVCVQQNGSFVVAVPSTEPSMTYVLSYDHPMIGSQVYTYRVDDTSFCSEVAPARTFVLYEEVAALLNEGLSQGGSVDNVIVIWQDHLSSELRFPDELARHKLMDLVGDLYLVGGLLQAEILAVKSGHALNVEFAREVIRRTGIEGGDRGCSVCGA